MRFTNSLQKVFLQYLEFFHVKITFRSSKHNFQVVFLAVKSISFLGWVLNLLILRNIVINFMVSLTRNKLFHITHFHHTKRRQWCWWRFLDVGDWISMWNTHFVLIIRHQHRETRTVYLNVDAKTYDHENFCTWSNLSPTPNKSDLLKWNLP